MTDPITTYYSDNPVDVLADNTREIYDPQVRIMWENHFPFKGLVTYAHQPGAQRATKMTFTDTLPVHVNASPIDNRAMWLPAMHIDSFQREIGYERHGGKVAYHEYDSAKAAVAYLN